MSRAQMRTTSVLAEVFNERGRQDAKFGDIPDGTGGPHRDCAEMDAKARCDRRAAEGKVTFADVLEEEVAEALAAHGADLRTELLQVAAVCVKWIEAIDRRTT